MEDQIAQLDPNLPPEASVAGDSPAAGNEICTTVNFDAVSGNPPSYTESGITVTSLHPAASSHLHLTFGPVLLNHSSCCSTPYEFERTDGEPFTVASLDIVSAAGPVGSGNFVSSSGDVLARPGAVGTLIFPAAGWTGITSFRWNEFGFSSIDNLVICPAVIEVDIDIKPGSDPNSINLGNRGDIPVAILTTDDFDAADVDATTVTLGNDDGNDTGVAARRNGSLKASLEDVDDDGDLDLILHFETQALVGNGDLDANSTELILKGETTGGLAIQGSDAVRIVP